MRKKEMTHTSDISYWYFTYHITNADSDISIKDDGVIASENACFPIQNVLQMCACNFGEDYRLMVTNVVPIDKIGFDSMYAEMSKFVCESEMT